MDSSPQRRAELDRRIAQYERWIASFERMNVDMREMKVGALHEVSIYCDTHIATNERTLVTLRRALELAKQQRAEEAGPTQS